MKIQSPILSPLDWLMLFALAAIWGSSYFFVAIVLKEFSPMVLVTHRVLITFLAFLPIAFIMKQIPRIDGLTILQFFGLGLINNVLPFIFISWGQKEVASGLAAILNATTPLFTVLVAGVFLEDEKMTRQKILGSLLGLVGVGIIIGPSALQGITRNLGSQLAFIAAALCYALSSIFGRIFARKKLSPMTMTLGMMGASSVIMLILSLASGESFIIPSASVGVAVITLAILCTGIAYLLYFRVLRSAGATNLMLVTFLIPISAIFLGYIFLEERLAANHFFGMGVIGFGLAFIDGRPLQKIRARFER